MCVCVSVSVSLRINLYNMFNHSIPRKAINPQNHKVLRNFKGHEKNNHIIEKADKFN